MRPKGDDLQLQDNNVWHIVVGKKLNPELSHRYICRTYAKSVARSAKALIATCSLVLLDCIPKGDDTTFSTELRLLHVHVHVHVCSKALVN